MSYQLGVDLGTTYTAAAVCRSSDRQWSEPEVVTLGTRSATVPSVLFVAPDGSVLVGETAERRALTDPDRVVREFKRRIGDPTPVVVAGAAWAPEELAARLVSWVVDRVAEREGGPAARIAVTHPASWGTHKKELLAAALAGRGLTVTFLAEPQAAALHYAAAERIPAGATIAVYDLGGGTFDAAVVRKGDPLAEPGAAGFGLLGRPEGIERLGGVDFDEAVFEHVREGLPAAFEELDDTDPAVLSAVSRVRRDCTEAKEALSSDTEVSIPVLMPAARGSVRLHRSEFEAMIRPQVEQTVAALRSAIGSAGVETGQLATVLLVGGSSRIPLVAQLVSEQFGRPVAVDADPKNSIAKGAALAVSPRPTVSWPGAVIAPVPTPAGAAAPPVRPPLGDVPAVAVPMPARGPIRHSHEPVTALLSSGGLPPGWQEAPTYADTPQASVRQQAWDRKPAWDPRPARRPRRPVGLFVGAGGLLAVAAVVVAAMVWPDTSANAGIQTEFGSVPISEVAPVTVEVPPPVEPAPQPAPEHGPATANGGSGSGGTKPPAGTPVPPTTVAPIPPATIPPTTTPPLPPVAPPPSSAPVTDPGAESGVTEPVADPGGVEAGEGGSPGDGAEQEQPPGPGVTTPTPTTEPSTTAV